MNKPKAVATKIWDKFTAIQKRRWRMFFRDFRYEWGISAEKLTKHEREVIASNHATLATWAMGK